MRQDIKDEIVRILNSSKDHEEALGGLTAFVEKLRQEGEIKDVILASMQELRRSVSDEQEDILLDVMDFLVGWCSPQAKIE